MLKQLFTLFVTLIILIFSIPMLQIAKECKRAAFLVLVSDCGLVLYVCVCKNVGGGVLVIQQCTQRLSRLTRRSVMTGWVRLGVINRSRVKAFKKKMIKANEHRERNICSNKPH